MWLIFSNFAGNNKNTPKMKIRLLFSLLLCATAATLPAANVYWFDGRQHVSYVRQKKLSPVVEQAIDLFSADMTAVTGRNAQEKSNGQIVIFQLDLLDNKEFKQLTALHVPINKFIARPEAFYIGLRGQNIVVAGSDARGTAYGLLELSRQAGVSPWTETGLPPSDDAPSAWTAKRRYSNGRPPPCAPCNPSATRAATSTMTTTASSSA